jgi:hypothetical protein
MRYLGSMLCITLKRKVRSDDKWKQIKKERETWWDRLCKKVSEHLQRKIHEGENIFITRSI